VGWALSLALLLVDIFNLWLITQSAEQDKTKQQWTCVEVVDEWDRQFI
jgi:hypothetical protein